MDIWLLNRLPIVLLVRETNLAVLILNGEREELRACAWSCDRSQQLTHMKLVHDLKSKPT